MSPAALMKVRLNPWSTSMRLTKLRLTLSVLGLGFQPTE